MSAFYTVLVRDKDGGKVGMVHPIKGLKFGKRLNNYGSAEFSIKNNDPMAGTLIDLRKNYIDVFRTEPQGIAYLLQEDGDFLLQENGSKLILEKAGTKVWSGEMATSRAILDNGGNNWVTVGCHTWFEQLYHRFTGLSRTFTSTDAGQIAAQLVRETNEQGETGIAIGKIEQTVNRNRTYQNQNIADGIMNLSDVLSGFDFEVDNDRTFNVYNVMGEDKTNSLVFQYGHNLTRAEVIEDFASPANRAIILGEATDENNLLRVERNDVALQAEYGLYEARMTEEDVSTESTMNDKGDALIRKYGTALIKIDFDVVRNLTPSIDQFDVGDGVRLIIKDGMYNIDEEYRVFEWQMEVGTDNSEKLSLILGKFTI